MSTTIKCKRVTKAVAADLKAYMFEIVPEASVVTPGTPDKVSNFKVQVVQGYHTVIAAITAAVGIVKTSNYPTEAQIACTQGSVGANFGVITKAGGISETVGNSEGTWTVVFSLGITLNGGNTVSGHEVTLTLESPFNV